MWSNFVSYRLQSLWCLASPSNSLLHPLNSLSPRSSSQYRIGCQQVGNKTRKFLFLNSMSGKLKTKQSSIDSTTSIPEELVKCPQPGQRRRFSRSQSLRKPQYKNRSTEQRALSIGGSPLPLRPEVGQVTNKTRRIERRTSLANINNQFFSLISISTQVLYNYLSLKLYHRRFFCCSQLLSHIFAACK